MDHTKQIVIELFKQGMKKKAITEEITNRSDTINLTYDQVKRIIHDYSTRCAKKEEKITLKQELGQ